MKKIITLFYCVLTLSLSAQTGFNHRFGSTYSDRSRKVIQTSDGNFLVVGETMSFGSASNAFIMKTDQSGNALWVKDYSGINSDIINDLVELDDHKLVMCGSTGSYGAGSNDAFLMKTDENGLILWAKSYGDIFSESFTSLSEDGEGGFYVSGHAYSVPNNTEGVIVSRISSTGEVIWTRKVSGYSYPDPQLISLTSGGVILGCNISPNTSFSLWKFSSTGNTVWSKDYFPTPAGSGLTDLDLLEAANGDILAITSLANVNTVAQQQDFFIIRLNSSGNLIWDKSYGKTYNENATSALIAHDGAIIVSGYTNSAGNGDSDHFIAKIADNGTFQWAQAYGTPWDDRLRSIYETAQNGFIFTGSTYPIGSNPDSLKVYLGLTDVAGNTECSNFAFNLITANQTLIIGAATPSTIYTLPKNESVTWNLNNRYFYNVNACQPLSVGIHDKKITFSFSPNPFSSSTNLHTDDPLQDATILIYNSLGQMVKQVDHLNGTDITIQRDDLTSGIYFIQLSQNGLQSASEKLVIID